MNVHELDQMIAAFGDLSRLAYEYRRKLIEAGFNNDEAIRITAQWTAHITLGK